MTKGPNTNKGFVIPTSDPDIVAEAYGDVDIYNDAHGPVSR